MGGVLPVDRNHIAMRESWLELLGALTQDMGIPRHPLQRRRSVSRVSLSGLDATTPVWLEAPFTMTVGALASPRGEASLASFHAGQAELIQGDQKIEVILSPDEREGSRVYPKTRKVQWPSL